MSDCNDKVKPAVIRNGCFNHPKHKQTLIVQSGWYKDLTLGPKTRMPTLTVIPVAFKPGCQYSVHTVDKRCVGCTHNQQPR